MSTNAKYLEFCSDLSKNLPKVSKKPSKHTTSKIKIVFKFYDGKMFSYLESLIFFSEATTTSKNYPTGYIGMIEQMMR
jgi:hypothetical protein